MSTSKLSRREFLQRAAVLGVAAAGAGALLAGCSKGGGGGGELSCNDTTGLPADQKAMRDQLKYVDKSAEPAKTCDNCQLYKAPAAAGQCGGCTIFQGPVHPKGYCVSWAAKQA